MTSAIAAPNAYSVNKNYVFDTRLNVTNLNDPLDVNRNATAGFDSKSRVTSYNYGASGNNYSYTYNTGDDRSVLLRSVLVFD